jgi:peptide/nickel transport system substrate-binding protein
MRALFIHSRQWYYRCLPALLLLLLLSACTGTGTQPAAAPDQSAATATPFAANRGAGDTLRLILWIAPGSLNPHISPGLHDFQASRIAYEPLASFDRAGQLVPFLAAEIPSRANGGLAADGMSVTWQLRSDVVWSDGTPFTAADVRFTYDYITNPAVAGHAAVAYEAVEQVEIIDDHTVRVQFNAPTPAWAVPFVGRYGLILPQHIFAEYNGANYAEAPANNLPVGTGPYRVVSFEPQEVLFLGDRLVETNKVVYVPNERFREPDNPYFSRVELHGWGLPELSAQAVLVSGTDDYVYDVQLTDDQLQALETLGEGVATINFGRKLLLLELNSIDPDDPSGTQPHPIFSDPEVRQALNLAIDREAIVQDIFGRAGRPVNTILPALEAEAASAAEFDPQAAAALLAAAGWRDSDGDGVRERDGQPLRVRYTHDTGPLSTAVAALVQQRLTDIGFAVTMTDIDVRTLAVSVAAEVVDQSAPAIDIVQHLVTSSTLDPGIYLGRWTCAQVAGTAGNGQGTNPANWCDARYDELYAQSRTELDAEARQQLFAEMQARLLDAGFVLPVVQVADVSGVSTTLTGVEWTPWDAEVWQIKDWKR